MGVLMFKDHISHSFTTSDVMELDVKNMVRTSKGKLIPASAIYIRDEKLSKESLIGYAIDALCAREEKWLSLLEKARIHNYPPQLPKPISNLHQYAVDFARKQESNNGGMTQTNFRNSKNKRFTLKSVESLNSEDGTEDLLSFLSLQEIENESSDIAILSAEQELSEKEQRYSEIAGSFLESLLDAVAGPDSESTIEGLAEIITKLKGKSRTRMHQVLDRMIENIHSMRDAGLLFDNDEDAIRAGVMAGITFRDRK